MKRKTTLIILIAVAIVTSYFFVSHVLQQPSSDITSKQSILADIEDSIGFQLPSPKTLFGVNIDSFEVYEGEVKRNENLAAILANFNVTAKKIAEIGRLPKTIFDVRKIQTRKPFVVIHEKDTLKTAKYFIYQPNPIDYVMIELGDSVVANQGKNRVDTIASTLSGVIEYSLYQTIVDAGASPLLVNDLADVYAWVIDFFGLQKDDAFKVIYEKYEVNGVPAGIGNIKAAWFRHAGSEYFAVAYDQGEGSEFFDEEGNSLRKTFLKAPLKYSRISSGFSNARMHPVLKIVRPHHGVDYAAPTGTPVVAIGDGTVTKAAYSGGAGHMVKIKHNSNYETAYLHLSKYGAGIKAGVRVKQGQVIGYVGSTGLSTGPHLDFRFYKNGHPVNPLKIDPPSADPIKEEEKEKYTAHKEIWVSKLKAIPLDEVNIVM